MLEDFVNVFNLVSRNVKAGACYMTPTWTFNYNNTCVHAFPQVTDPERFKAAKTNFLGPYPYKPGYNVGCTRKSEHELEYQENFETICKLSADELENLRIKQLWAIIWPTDGCFTLMTRRPGNIIHYDVIYKSCVPNRELEGTGRIAAGDILVDFKAPVDNYIAYKKNSPQKFLVQLAVDPRTGEYLYRPMPQNLKPEDIKITYNNKTYKPAAWSGSMYAYTTMEEIDMVKTALPFLKPVKKIVEEAITKELENVAQVPEDLVTQVTDEIAAKKASKQAPKAEPAPTPVDEAPWKDESPWKDEALPEPEKAPVEDPVKEPEAVVEEVTLDEPAEQPADGRARRKMKPRVVTIKNFDYKRATEYMAQPLPEGLTVEAAIEEARNLRDILIYMARRNANLSLFLYDALTVQEAKSKELQTLKQLLKSIKL